MWLLDVNLPTALAKALAQLGIEAHTTAARGWRDMENGALAKVASDAGFKVILTRDKLFGESASKALRAYPHLAVVIVTIRQSREAVFLDEFRAAWAKNSISPTSGGLTYWP